MLSFEQCKQVLNSGDKKYSDEKIIKIREFLYQLAKVDVEFYKFSKNEKRTKSNSV